VVRIKGIKKLRSRNKLACQACVDQFLLSFTLMLLVHWILSLVHLYSKYAGTANVCTNNYPMSTLFPR